MTNQTEVVNLISPQIEDEPTDTNNDILLINTKICQEGGAENNKNDDEEEHESQGEETAKKNTQTEKIMPKSPTGTIKLKLSVLRTS